MYKFRVLVQAKEMVKMIFIVSYNCTNYNLFNVSVENDCFMHQEIIAPSASNLLSVCAVSSQV